MTTLKKVMKNLEAKGSAQTRKIYLSHGAADGKLYGVKVADMKVIAKTIKGQQDLAYELYDTGNFDAMYLAGMVATGTQMTATKLRSWARTASWQWISEYTVPWVAAESSVGRKLALEWIDAKKEHVAAAGWNTLAGMVSTHPDESLDMATIKGLLKRVEKDIAAAPNRVKYCMNGFVIAVGCYVSALNKTAKATAKKIGKVSVDVGKTACKTPVALDYIVKVEKAGRLGKKRKNIRC